MTLVNIKDLERHEEHYWNCPLTLNDEGTDKHDLEKQIMRLIVNRIDGTPFKNEEWIVDSLEPMLERIVKQLKCELEESK